MKKIKPSEEFIWKLAMEIFCNFLSRNNFLSSLKTRKLFFAKVQSLSLFLRYVSYDFTSHSWNLKWIFMKLRENNIFYKTRTFRPFATDLTDNWNIIELRVILFLLLDFSFLSSTSASHTCFRSRYIAQVAHQHTRRPEPRSRSTPAELRETSGGYESVWSHKRIIIIFTFSRKLL